MTDYELVYLASEMGDAITDIFSVYISILFAFLVISFLVAQRLSTGMVVVVLGSFTLYSIYSGLRTMGILATFNNLTVRIGVTSAEDTSDLDWHPAAGMDASTLATNSSVIWWFVLLMLIAVYVGAMYFFYSCRRGEFRDVLA